MCKSAAEVINSEPDHHHTYGIAVGLSLFNCTPPMEMVLSDKASASEAQAITASWKALVTTLQSCLTRVRERRAKKSLEDFNSTISGLLEDYNKVLPKALYRNRIYNFRLTSRAILPSKRLAKSADPSSLLLKRKTAKSNTAKNSQ